MEWIPYNNEILTTDTSEICESRDDLKFFTYNILYVDKENVLRFGMFIEWRKDNLDELDEFYFEEYNSGKYRTYPNEVIKYCIVTW